MNNVKAIQKLNEQELKLGLDSKKSWHDMYSDSAYIFIGGLDFALTEGDVLSVFSQYGEIVNINLVRDKKTGKSKGFCFLCYEDQRSTILAVDNFNGIKLCGRTIRVDHVKQYRRPKDSDGNEIVEKGCAPKTPTPSPTPSESTSPEPEVKKKKTKKEKHKKKKRKLRLRKRRESTDGDDDEGKQRSESNEEDKLSDKTREQTADDNPKSRKQHADRVERATRRHDETMRSKHSDSKYSKDDDRAASKPERYYDVPKSRRRPRSHSRSASPERSRDRERRQRQYRSRSRSRSRERRKDKREHYSHLRK